LSMRAVANPERSAANQPMASAANLSSSSSVRAPSAMSADRAASAPANTPNGVMSSGTAAGLTAHGISRNPAVAQSNLTAARPTSLSLRSPAVMASLAHAPAAANANAAPKQRAK
jgi:hypothetical protein